MNESRTGGGPTRQPSPPIPKGGKGIILIVRNDDPSACSDVEHERRIAEIFERYSIPQCLGVIPYCPGNSRHDPLATDVWALDSHPEMVAFLREYAATSGSEIALHGYTHRTNRLSRPSRREYFEFRRLSLAEQTDMIRRGTELLTRVFGTCPRVFIPPWNRLDSNTVRACAANGYRIISSGLYAPTVDGMVSLGTNCGIGDFPALLKLGQTAERRVFLHVLYHSATTRTPQEIDALERVLELVAQTKECEALTISEAVERYPKDVCLVNDAARNVVPQSEIFGSQRARVVVYRRLLERMPWRTELETSYDMAKAGFREGRYKMVHELSEKIDRLAYRLLVRARIGVGLGGLLFALCLGGSTFSFGAAERWYGYSAAGLLTLMGGALVWWHATASDTKNEIRAGVQCFGLGGLSGTALIEAGRGLW